MNINDLLGLMDKHIRDVTSDHPWAQYFRVGDTPSVLYLIDHSHLQPCNLEIIATTVTIATIATTITI